MRRLCLFVHTPVTPSLMLGINALESDLFSRHALKLDAELFPLLLEAKPCVILASIADADSSASVYNLMREFKEFRISNGSAARDPGLRIVIVSEGQIPRLNWASLGIYELIIGPVQANVLTYKLNRHYHKAVDAGEPEPEVTPNLVKDVEMKAELTTPEWKVFTNDPQEKTQKRIFKKEETEIKEISLRMAIRGLNPKAGEWKKSKIQMDPPPQWNWEYKQSTEDGPTHWSFRGEEPIYHPDDGTWQFTSTVPKLLSYPKNSDQPETQFEYLPKSGGGEDGKLKVKSELELKSIRSQTYDQAKSEQDPLIILDDEAIHENDLEITPEELEAAAVDLEKSIAERKQNYGERPRDLDVSEGEANASGRIREYEETSRTEKTRKSHLTPLQPNYGARPRERDELSDEPSEANNPRPKKRQEEDSLAATHQAARNFDSTEASSESSASGPDSFDTEKNKNQSKVQREVQPNYGDPRPLPIRKTNSIPIKSVRTSPADGGATETSDNQSEALHSVPLRQKPASSSPSASKNKSKPTATDLEARLTANYLDDGISKTDHRKPSPASETSGSTSKNFTNEKPNHSQAARIQKDAELGSLSVLYDDEAKKKNQAKKEASTEILLFDEHIWKFRMVRHKGALLSEDPASTSGQKLSLAPQQKLSLEEKRSLMGRILRFILDFFGRGSKA